MQQQKLPHVNFVAKLMRLQEKLNVKGYELATALGISRVHLSRLKGGARPSLQLEKNVDHLLGSTVTLGKSNATELVQSLQAGLPPNASIPAPVPKSRLVPVVSWANAGLGDDYEDLCRQIEEWVETDCKDPNAYAVIIEGDSMEPDVHAGDRVVLNPNAEARNGDMVVARLQTGEVFFKRFSRTGSEGGVVRLESLNTRYATKDFPAGEFRFIHPAVNLIRKFRR